ncbi:MULTISPECIES: hypothetical protein [unclassified Mesorhizobium]|uniref:hypothetical protein n=1 Tax=unclassified Mesorhizobium TaxID=325217 RepID=UPI0003CFB5E7|nr:MULTISPECIES: hypothetical protein [unclassified Mesorhizobium]ESZ07282.1 hypothetical protein X736_13490 [Mesorhizobium sp. L2C089B000]ESZ33868.1 hypothetical protein X733_13835 [Mesorhizobium sp. L2C067A000]WJI53029.1 hypothetical protein NLY44_10330 [Mesorhizobium sp. C089B]
MPKLIGQDLWFSNIEIDDYLANPNNAIAHVDDQADVLATLGEELRTDLVGAQGTREALYDDVLEGEYPEELYSETMDLCDIVEAVEKGHIIYG